MPSTGWPVDREVIDRALAEAARAARREYVRWGHAMPVWRDGRLAWVSADVLARLERERDGEVAARSEPL